MDTKALRQKVLDLAIRGKLVPQDPNDEPASVLLERIRQQKQQMVKDGKLKVKDIKNDTIIFVGEDNLHYEKFADGSVKCIEDEIPFELPDGWAWVRLSSIADMALGKMLDVAKNKGALRPYLRNINVRWGAFDLSDILEMRFEDNELERYSIRHGDLVICEGGEPGRCAVWQSEEVVFYQKALHRVRAIEVLPEYLHYVIRHFITSTQYERYYTGTTIKHLTGQSLRILPIPLPPMSEQQSIVQQLQRIIEEIDKVETEKTEALSLVSLAKDKILDLAIRGQLVPQDPADEPASVLLERIRAEKEELIKQGKIKRDKKESVIFRGEDNSYYEKIGEKISKYDVDELPWGWSVGSFSQVNVFTSETVDPSNSPGEMFELYSVPNFEVGAPEIIIGKEIGSSKQSICENDVLVCKINPRINRVWITGHITSYRILGSSEWIAFRNHLLFAPYLRYYFSSPYFRKLMLSNVSGVGGSLMRAQPESVKKYPVLIPPYQEQIRIAERLDELLALLTAIEKSLS